MKVRVPKDFGNSQQAMMGKIQKMQDEMAEKTTELEQKEYTISSGGGAVTLVITGKKELKNVTISPDVADDMDMLGDLVCAAVNEGIKQVEDIYNEEIEKITGQVSIPGMNL